LADVPIPAFGRQKDGIWLDISFALPQEQILVFDKKDDPEPN
jgi:hypothetical protein